MFGIGARGMGAAIDGFYRGRDEETQRQATQEDREYLRTQRANQLAQQERTRQEQARADQLRSDLSAIPSERDVEMRQAVPNDDDGNAMPAITKRQAVPMDLQLRQAADAFKKAGDITKYLEATGKADQLQMQRSVERLTQLEGMTAGKSTLEIAGMAQQIFDEDPFPQRIRSVKDDGQGGVIAEIENTDTGGVVTQNFKTPADITNGLRALYNPQGYAALQAARQKAAIEAQAKAAEPYTLKPGEQRMVGGQKIAEGGIKPGYEVLTNPDGSTVQRPIGGGQGGAGGAAGGRGAGKAPPDAVSAAREVFTDIAKNSEDKLTTDQYAAAEDSVARIVANNSGRPGRRDIPPAMAARVAVAVAKNPGALKPMINPETGTIDMVYADGANGPVVFNRGIATAVQIDNLPLEALGVKPEDAAKMSPNEQRAKRQEALRGMTGQMLQALPPQERSAMEKAARSPEERGLLEQGLRDQAAKVIAEKSAGKTPEQAAQIKQVVEQALAERLRAVGNNLDMIFNYGPQPKERPAERRINPVGGLFAAAGYNPPPDSPAGRAQARREAARLEAERQANQRQSAQSAEQDTLSRQFQADAKTLSPLELARKYDALRGKLSSTDAAQLQTIERQIS